MDSLYLLQFAVMIFSIVNAAFVALGFLNTRWQKKRYECSRWMIVVAYLGLAWQFYMQMKNGYRASSDNLGAVFNILVYTPCISLISFAIFNIESLQHRRVFMVSGCLALYAAICAVFFIGYSTNDTPHLGWCLYVMLFLYILNIVFCVGMVAQAMVNRRRKLEELTAQDIIPFVRYARTSVVTLFVVAFITPFSILHTPLLYIAAPLVMGVILFFSLCFVSLGNCYSPLEAWLENEELISPTKPKDQDADTQDNENGIVILTESHEVSSPIPFDKERQVIIEEKLENWRASYGYRDSTMNMIALAHYIGISKRELSLYFDKCLNSTFRIWLSDIRFVAAQDLILAHPEYNNDVVSIECGFSSRTQLYRIFKAKTGLTPTAWRESVTSNQDSSIGA